MAVSAIAVKVRAVLVNDPLLETGAIVARGGCREGRLEPSDTDKAGNGGSGFGEQVSIGMSRGLAGEEGASKCERLNREHQNAYDGNNEAKWGGTHPQAWTRIRTGTAI